jgi:hypothetical protein
MHRLFVILVGLGVLALLLTACGTPPAIGPTPEAALEQLLAHVPELPPGSVPHLHIHGTRTTPLGTVLLYSAEYSTPAGEIPQPVAGYALVEQYGDAWLVTAASLDPPTPPASMAPVVFAEVPMILPSGTQRIIYGWARPDAEVATVEVVFDTGESQHDAVTEGMFAFVPEGDPVVCEIQARDHQGQVIYQQHMDPAAPGAPPEIQQRIQKCQP